MSPMGLSSAKKKVSSDKTLPCGRPTPKLSFKNEVPADAFEKLVLKLNQFCVSKNLNRSDAREKILKVIIQQAHHFTAVELLERLQKRFPDIGKATLYRNLPIFVESDVLKEGPNDSNGQVLYELSGDDHHDHIVCLNCRQIFEFHDDAIEKRQNQVSNKLGFTAQDHHHVIYAACDYYQK